VTLLLASILNASAAEPVPELFARMATLPSPYLPPSAFAAPPPGGGGAADGSRLLDVYRYGDLALLVDEDGEWLAEATSQVATSGGDFSWILGSMSGAFYKDFGDDYDYLTVLMVKDFGLFFAFYSPMANDVEGIGYANFAGRDTFDLDATNKLQGFIFMNYYGEWYENRASGRYVFGQEFMHRWGAFVEVEHDELPADALLGRDSAHWTYWMDTPNSPMEGNEWVDQGDGTWTVDFGATSTYSPLDLYLMGFAPPEEVGPLTVLQVSDEEASGVNRNPASTPEYLAEATSGQGRAVQVSATPVTLGIEHIVAAEGERVPDASASPREFRMAFLVLVLADDTLDDAVLAEVDSVRTTFEADWEADVQARADLITTLGDGDAPTWGDTTPTDPGTTDSGTTTDTGPGLEEDDTDKTEEAAGCGCGTGVDPTLLAFAPALLALVRRRR